MQTIGTHSGSFHADDALGVAILTRLHPEARVVRSRHPQDWQACAFLVDVGGEYDPLRRRFDHHQRGFSLARQNGIRYAGAGLVWLAYGERYVRSVWPSAPELAVKAVAQEVDARLIAHIDAHDNGIEVPRPLDVGLSSMVDAFNPNWDETDTVDERFAQASALAGTVLYNFVKKLCAEQSALDLIVQARREADGRILVLDKPRLQYEPFVLAYLPDVLFVVYPDSLGVQYQVRVVPQALGSFEARADLPAGWAGFRDAELAQRTGVADAVFCHNGRFIAGARSMEGALALARKAVAQWKENNLA